VALASIFRTPIFTANYLEGDLYLKMLMYINKNLNE